LSFVASKFVESYLTLVEFFVASGPQLHAFLIQKNEEEEDSMIK
jgi:hypothetical protein